MNRGLFLSLLAGVLVLGTGTRIYHLQNSRVVHDEFQHLHAAYLVSSGLTPYQDFFEHHTPLFYYLVPLVVDLTQGDFNTVLSARLFSFSFSALSVAFGFMWGYRLRGVIGGVVVSVVMVANYFLFLRGSILFLDTFAAPLLVASAMLLSGSRRSLQLFLSGLLLGVAILFTQKAVMVVFAPALILASEFVFSGKTGINRFKPFVSYGCGGLLAPVILVGLIGSSAMNDFIRCAIVMNLNWKARHFPVQEIAAISVTDGVICLLAVVASLFTLRGLKTERFRVSDDAIPSLFFLSLCLGIFLIPVTWFEYFVPLVTFATVSAGLMLVDLFQGSRKLSRHEFVCLIVLCVALSVAGVSAKLFVSKNPISFITAALVVVIWASLAMLVRNQTIRRSPNAIAICVLLILVTFPLAEQCDRLRHASNSDQRARLSYVQSVTPPEVTIFDGYSGYGVFRPHAYKYWFFHDEIQLMATERELGQDVIDALKLNRPMVVVVDKWTKTLPQSVLDHIDEHYARTAFEDIRVRRR